MVCVCPHIPRAGIFVWALVARSTDTIQECIFGIDSNWSEQVEFGSFLKVGDASTSS
jgi:hypothetical protein